MSEEREEFVIGRVVEDEYRIVYAELDADRHGPPPPFGSLVKITSLQDTWFGLVTDAQVHRVDRRSSLLRHGPAAMLRRITDEALEATIMKLQIVILGMLASDNDRLAVDSGQRKPRRLRAPVIAASEEEVQMVAMESDFLKRLIDLPAELPVNELIVASLRRFSNCFPDPMSFLMLASKELSRLARNDQSRVAAILKQVGFSTHDVHSGSR